MKIEVARYGAKYAPDTMATIHIMRTTCPRCKEPVQFAIDNNDKQYKDDVEYYENLVPNLQREIKRLNQVIDKMLL